MSLALDLSGCTQRPVFGLRCQFSEYRYSEFFWSWYSYQC